MQAVRLGPHYRQLGDRRGGYGMYGTQILCGMCEMESAWAVGRSHFVSIFSVQESETCVVARDGCETLFPLRGSRRA